MNNTMLLDQARWDVILDANGNWAVATDPYSMAQDVASACRLFIGELWYDTTKGIPYFENVLGQSPPTEFLKAQLVAAALTVPGVIEAQAVMISFINGVLSGQIIFSDKLGNLQNVTISSGLPPPDTSGTGTNPSIVYDRLDIDFNLDRSILA